MYYFFITALIFNILSSPYNDKINIEINIDSVKYVYKNELLLYGDLKITNKTNKVLKLPKSFDMKLIISDSLGNTVMRNTVTEELNLIRNKHRIKIPPYSFKYIIFTETRLSDYNLKKNTFYNIKYLLIKNQKGIGLSENYETNTCKFKLPD